MLVVDLFGLGCCVVGLLVLVLLVLVCLSRCVVFTVGWWFVVVYGYCFCITTLFWVCLFSCLCLVWVGGWFVLVD